VIAVITGAGITIAVNRLFLKPLGRIQRGTEAMERGDLSLQIPVTSQDEIGDLARKFNRMAETLQRSFGELEDKNTQLAEQVQLVFRSQKEWQETFDSITDPISLIKKDCTIIKANLAFRETFGESLLRDETADRKCHEIFETCWLANCPLKTNSGDQATTRDEIHVPTTGKIFDVSMFPYHSPEGGFTGSVLIAKDITEMKKNEMRMITSERLSALGQISSGIAHEFNTPLATIATCAEGLVRRIKKGQWDSSFFEKYLMIIKEEVHRCTQITKSILSIVKRIPEEKKDINLTAVLDKTLEVFSLLGRLGEIQVVKKYKEGMLVIHMNEGQLKQVFLSIIANGLDAMNDKGTLTLETGTEGDTVFIRIIDTGPGIPSSFRAKIFEPFFTTKSEKGGTGLGLPTADKIIRENNGRIEVTSEEGQGSIFKIILPPITPSGSFPDPQGILPDQTSP
jgi:PAS domain S-box-containing protein